VNRCRSGAGTLFWRFVARRGSAGSATPNPEKVEKFEIGFGFGRSWRYYSRWRASGFVLVFLLAVARVVDYSDYDAYDCCHNRTREAQPGRQIVGFIVRRHGLRL
jgi:hypothetical protein